MYENKTADIIFFTRVKRVRSKECFVNKRIKATIKQVSQFSEACADCATHARTNFEKLN